MDSRPFDYKTVIVVGGGPIGLAHAIGMKLLNPSLRVVVLEQYPLYQRKHTLNMMHAMLEEYQHAVEGEQQVLLSQLLAKLKADSHIRTNELEEDYFKSLATQLDVEIQIQKVNEETIDDQLLSFNPSLIIGADGTHSTVSKKLFPPDNQVKHEFDYVLQLRYEIKGEEKASPLNKTQFFQNMARQGMIANEYIGAYDEAKGVTPVTTQMMISKKDFEALNGKATSQNPIKPAARHPIYRRSEIPQVVTPDQDTWSIVTPQGLYQLNKKKTSYECILDAQEIAEAKLGDILLETGTDLEAPQELQLDIDQTTVLDQLIVAKGGRSLYANYQSIPKKPLSFITQYLADQVRSGAAVLNDSISISVNEAPATHAKQVFTFYKGIPVVLVGDAGLGLSYFKGLNAGLKSTAELFLRIKKAIKGGFSRPEEFKKALSGYQEWFLNHFVPEKVKEVASYSRNYINFPWRFMESLSLMKGSSFISYDDYEMGLIREALIIKGNDVVSTDLQNDRFQFYPHRPYAPAKLVQWDSTPLYYHLKKIKKLGFDYFKPYKSKQHLIQDLKQPLVGFGNIFVGLFKIPSGIIFWDKKLFSDGCLTFLRGVLEFGTTPLAWFLKPLTRGFMNLIKPTLQAENNKGIQELSKELLQKISGEQSGFTSEQIYTLIAQCYDIHRKFNKQTDRGQKTQIALDEILCFTTLERAEKKEDKLLAITQYATLFSQAGKRPLKESHPASHPEALPSPTHS